MPHIIPCQTELSDRFPVASFAVKVPHDRYFELAFATDPSLFHPKAAHRRTSRNFYTSRSSGLMRAPAGQATYLLPSQQLRRFAGRSRLHYALATYDSPRGDDPRVSVRFDALDKTPFVRMASGFSGRPLDRARLGRGGADGAGYGGKTGVMNWGGDLVAEARPTADAGAFEYDDGYDPSLWQSAAARPHAHQPHVTAAGPAASAVAVTPAEAAASSTYGGPMGDIPPVPGADDASHHAEAYGSVTGPIPDGPSEEAHDRPRPLPTTPLDRAPHSRAPHSEYRGVDAPPWAPAPPRWSDQPEARRPGPAFAVSDSDRYLAADAEPDAEPDGWEDGAAYHAAIQGRTHAGGRRADRAPSAQRRFRGAGGPGGPGGIGNRTDDDVDIYDDDNAWDSAASALDFADSSDEANGDHGDDDGDEGDDFIEIEPEVDDFGIDEGYTGRRRARLRPPADPPGARRLDPVGKANLLYAVSDARGDSQPFAAWSADARAGVCYGIGRFDQRSGALGALLRRCHDEDPAGFAEVYGAGWQRLLQVTNAGTAEQRLGAVDGASLADPAWSERFARAAGHRPFQRAQLKEAAARHIDPNLAAAARLGLHRDRALAALVDRCITQGNAAGVADLAETLCPVKRADVRAGDLRALDDTLSTLGYGSGSVRARLRAWQRDRGVTDDGRVGPDTQVALVEALRERAPTPDATEAALTRYGGAGRLIDPAHPYLHDVDYALAEYV
ncbi:hypothetical protein [Haliangium sp.]|uniref:hypothetical protein n=1 Tax=Haliangium sp. TaxID=2663208 RepID=UPI003D123981